MLEMWFILLCMGIMAVGIGIMVYGLWIENVDESFWPFTRVEVGPQGRFVWVLHPKAEIKQKMTVGPYLTLNTSAWI